MLEKIRIKPFGTPVKSVKDIIEEKKAARERKKAEKAAALAGGEGNE